MNTLQNLLEECTQKGIIKIVVSNPRKGEKRPGSRSGLLNKKGSFFIRLHPIIIIRYIIKTEQERN